jgi:hypothetical protein
MRRPQKFRVGMTCSASKVVEVYAFNEDDAKARATGGVGLVQTDPMPAGPKTIEQNETGWTVTKVEVVAG